MKSIYLDYNATTKVADEVLTKMIDVFKMPLNNSSTHLLGRKANTIVEEGRQEIKNLLNAHNYEVIFTSTASEANNMAICGVAAKKILFCGIEHASVYNCRPDNKEIIEIAVLSNGLIDVEDLKNKLESINDGNFLVSLMFANNETGAIQPTKEVAKLVHQKGGLFHCDMVQGAGKVAVDIEEINVDFAAISAHKIRGPQGVAALLVRKGLDIKPLIFGGKQEKSKRAGTVNTAGIAGFGEACKLAAKNLELYNEVEKLRNYLENELKNAAGDDVKIFADSVTRLPNTCYVATKNINNQTQLIHFDLNRICISAGSACSSGSTSPARVLSVMKADPIFLENTVRISLGIDTTKAEIDKFIKVWLEIYNRTKTNK